jgi:ectoine hydroxylase-related dioxygenase (phytanoyl-CoA dioxygenase family)
MNIQTAIEKDTVAATYDRDGFVLPIDILSSEEAKRLRDDLESAEQALNNDPERLTLLHSYPQELLPSFAKLIKHPTIIKNVSAILGPDLLVWGASLFIKSAKSPKIISWHQDLTYWGLDDAQEVTCWVALSSANVDSGCMKFVAGSHKQRIVPHVDTHAEDNMLSRGQEIAVDVDEEDATLCELMPGQASMHHGHLFHASGPNTSDDRRIGMAIRFIQPSMHQESGDRPLVALASGVDRFGNFNISAGPRGRLQEASFDLCREDAELKKKLLF